MSLIGRCIWYSGVVEYEATAERDQVEAREMAIRWRVPKLDDHRLAGRGLDQYRQRKRNRGWKKHCATGSSEADVDENRRPGLRQIDCGKF